MDLKLFLQEAENVITSFEDKLQTLNTNRANPQALEKIRVVDNDDNSMLLPHIATIKVISQTDISVSVWDKQLEPCVDQAISRARLPFNIRKQGHETILTLPVMTREKKLEVVKSLKSIGEQYKTSIRNLRKNTRDKIKSANLAKDEEVKVLKVLDEETHNYCKKIEDQVEKRIKNL